MLKDIYIIKNDINNKVYIGQAKDSQNRFTRHCIPSAGKNDNSLIDKAISHYGKQHFWYEALDSQIKNYNEREQYWIQHFNSITPNGYNLTNGGEDPPWLPGAQHPESNLSDEEVKQLTFDLQYSSISLAQLALKYHFKSRTSTSEFNKGRTYYRSNIDYPIRKDTHIGKLSSQDVEKIVYYLKNTKRSYVDIASEFGVEYKAISRINKGLLHKINNLTYPIREGK